MKPVSASQTRRVEDEKMNNFTGKRRKQKATVKERILGKCNTENGAMPKDETQSIIRNEIFLKIKEFWGPNAEAHQWIEIIQGGKQNSVEAGGGRWTPILEVVWYTDEELNNLNTENLSGKCSWSIIWKWYWGTSNVPSYSPGFIWKKGTWRHQGKTRFQLIKGGVRRKIWGFITRCDKMQAVDNMRSTIHWEGNGPECK